MLKRLFSLFTGNNDGSAEDYNTITRANQDNQLHHHHYPSKRFKKVTFADQKRQQQQQQQEVRQLSQQVSKQLFFSVGDDEDDDDDDDELSNEDCNAAEESSNELFAAEDSSDLVVSPRKPSPRTQQLQYIEDLVKEEEEESEGEEEEDSNSQPESSQEEAVDQDLQQAADSCSEEESQVHESPESVGRINQKRALKLAGKAVLKQRHSLGESSDAKKHEKLAKKLLEEASTKMRSLKRTLDQSFKGVEELNCPICMDYIVSCRTAICGHSFCEMCISESMIHRKECPNCRKDIRKWVLSKSEIIDSAVKIMVTSKSDDNDDNAELKRYLERGKAHEEWRNKQSVEPVKPGEKVDALDTEYIWCKALVELKIRARGRKPLLYLHYEGWSRKYDEYIYVDSRRIAPLGLFTSRNDIPRYQNNSANNRAPMNYAQVIDSARNMQLNQDQIENAEVNAHSEQIDINDPNQVQEDVNEENEGSLDSLAERVGRDEPDPERAQESGARGASSGAAGSSNAQGTNLNRDSNLGRNGEGASSSNPFLRGRPSTRNSRSPFSFSIDQNRPHPVISSTNPFFMVSGNNLRNPFRPSGQVFSTSENRATSAHSRRIQQREVAQNAAASAANTTSLSRGVGLGQSSLVGLPFPRSSNREDTRAAGHLYCGVPTYRQSNPGLLAANGAEPAANRPETREERIQSPSIFGNRESRRLSVPSNSGNIMRGATQSNIFGATTTSSIADRCCSFGARTQATQRQVTQARVNLRSRNRGEPATTQAVSAAADQESNGNDRPVVAAASSTSTAQFASPFATSQNTQSNGPPNEPQQDLPEQVPASSDLLANLDAVLASSIDRVAEQEDNSQQPQMPQESNNIRQIISPPASVNSAAQNNEPLPSSATNVTANGANGAVNGDDMQQAAALSQQQSPENNRQSGDNNNAASKSMDKQ